MERRKLRTILEDTEDLIVAVVEELDIDADKERLTLEEEEQTNRGALVKFQPCYLVQSTHHC